MKKYQIASLLCLLFLVGCTTAPPDSITDVCRIFKQYPKWYWATQKVEKKWHVPIAVQMAIIHQESKFRAKAKPPRTKILWIIPWKRPTSAYGYSQVIDATWKNYIKSSGNRGADRDDFGDATDFIGWYAKQAKKRARISPTNAYALYLAYHEGIGGYMRGSHYKKAWLLNVARKVQNNANKYQSQLNACQSKLKKKPWYRFW